MYKLNPKTGGAILGPGICEIYMLDFESGQTVYTWRMEGCEIMMDAHAAMLKYFEDESNHKGIVEEMKEVMGPLKY